MQIAEFYTPKPQNRSLVFLFIRKPDNPSMVTSYFYTVIIQIYQRIKIQLQVFVMICSLWNGDTDREFI